MSPEESDKIVFDCPKCDACLQAGSKLAGKTADCPKCGASIRVPAGA